MLIGLDLGTTNIKALLVEPDGRIRARASVPVKLRYGSGGAVEQDLGEIWAATCQALRELASLADLMPVQAIGVSSQGGAIQILDGQGRPVGPVISWLDGRGQPYDHNITDELGRAWFAEHTGRGGSAVAVGQILRLSHESPHLLQPPHRIGFVGDCIVQRLCGSPSQDATSLSIAVMLNPRLAAIDPELLEILRLDASRLSPILPARQAAGVLDRQVAADTGVPAGIPVSTAVHDQYAAALGTAAVHDGDVMFGAGTAWVLLAATAKLVRPVIDDAFVCPHVIDGLYGQLLSLGNGGSSVSWALDFLGFDENERTRLDEVLAGIPPGCEGLRAWPFLAPGGGAGLPTGVAGRLAGLRLEHTRGHAVRAVVEGLACELARYLGFLEDAGLRMDRLRMCGGGARSRVTPQIIADVTGLPVACLVESETSALGAAIIARSLVESQTNLLSLAEQMMPPTQTFQPGPAAPRYREILDEYLGSLPGVSPRAPAGGPAARAVRDRPAASVLVVPSRQPTRDEPLQYVWTYKDIDRAFWAEHLEDWVPRRIIDAHIHLSDPRHRLVPMTEQRRRQYWVAEISEPLPAPDAVRCLSIVYPGRDVRCVTMGTPDLDYDLDAENAYNRTHAANHGWWSLALLRPQWSAEQVAAELDKPGVIGVKPYYSLISRSPDTRDEHIEASIFDFLPYHALEVLNERRAWVTLHVPKADRLGHPDNIRQIQELRRRYPKVILVIAHLGRCYTELHASEALPPLADDPGIFFDNSAVLNPYVHRLALQIIGPERILYGTDNPVFFMRGRRQWRGRTYINRTSYPFHFNTRREDARTESGYTLYMYEALLALKDACRQLSIGAGHIEAIFGGNAQRLIGSIPAQT